MIVKILSVGDAMVILAMILCPFLPLKWMMYAAGWLILKGGMFAFTGDIASYFDIFSGVYVVFYSFGISATFMSIIVAVYLGQKFMVSWL